MNESHAVVNMSTPEESHKCEAHTIIVKRANQKDITIEMYNDFMLKIKGTTTILEPTKGNNILRYNFSENTAILQQADKLSFENVTITNLKDQSLRYYFKNKEALENIISPIKKMCSSSTTVGGLASILISFIPLLEYSVTNYPNPHKSYSINTQAFAIGIICLLIALLTSPGLTSTTAYAIKFSQHEVDESISKLKNTVLSSGTEWQAKDIEKLFRGCLDQVHNDDKIKRE